MKTCSVNAVILSEDNSRLLIVQRRDVPVWVLPGGVVDQGETPEDAVLREGLEETGCNVSIVRKSGVYTPVNRLTDTTHVYVCNVKGGTPETGSETRDIGFFPIDALPGSFFHVHRDFVADALQGSQEIIEKPLSQVTYSSLLFYFLRHPLRVIRFALSKLGLPLNSL